MPASEEETDQTGGNNEPIFHRVETHIQTSQLAQQQVASGEIWGRAPYGSSIPTVQAYRNSLPPARRGIEFTSSVLPARGSGTPYEARWYLGHTPGVVRRQKNGEDFAMIPANVTNKQP